jgi:hypothetical protein
VTKTTPEIAFPHPQNQKKPKVTPERLYIKMSKILKKVNPLKKRT